MFPPIEPFKSGLLQVENGNSIYWEPSGNPSGTPAIFLHGGPGYGGLSGYRKMFDPGNFLIVYMDQRGCGQSRPLVKDFRDLAGNDTHSLIQDIEALRAHLGFEKWLVTGGSWGATLALAYSQAYPKRVTGIVLSSIWTTSEEEVGWVTEQVGHLYPKEWNQFAEAVEDLEGTRMIDRYYYAITNGDPEIRKRAAKAWCEWENAHISLGRNWTPFSIEDEVSNLRFATLVIHYWKHSGFLSAKPILSNMPLLSEIPGILIHGRFDVSFPLSTAWHLQQNWTNCQLIVVPDEGHGGPKMSEEMSRAITKFAG